VKLIEPGGEKVDIGLPPILKIYHGVPGKVENQGIKLSTSEFIPDRGDIGGDVTTKDKTNPSQDKALT
jgi:hypothetical protein